MRRNSHSIALIFVENIGSFSKLKIIGLDQTFLKINSNAYALPELLAAARQIGSDVNVTANNEIFIVK